MFKGVYQVFNIDEMQFYLPFSYNLHSITISWHFPFSGFPFKALFVEQYRLKIKIKLDFLPYSYDLVSFQIIQSE